MNWAVEVYTHTHTHTQRSYWLKHLKFYCTIQHCQTAVRSAIKTAALCCCTIILMMIVMKVTFTVKVTRRLMILCSFVFSKHFLQVCEHCIQKKIKQVADNINKHRFLVSTSKWQTISIVSLCLQVANNKHCFLESANTHCICELVLPAPGVNSDCICRQWELHPFSGTFLVSFIITPRFKNHKKKRWKGWRSC